MQKPALVPSHGSPAPARGFMLPVQPPENQPLTFMQQHHTDFSGHRVLLGFAGFAFLFFKSCLFSHLPSHSLLVFLPPPFLCPPSFLCSLLSLPVLVLSSSCLFSTLWLCYSTHLCNKRRELTPLLSHLHIVPAAEKEAVLHWLNAALLIPCK